MSFPRSTRPGASVPGSSFPLSERTFAPVKSVARAAKRIVAPTRPRMEPGTGAGNVTGMPSYPTDAHGQQLLPTAGDLSLTIAANDAGEDSSSIVDSAIYSGGARVASPESLAETYQALREHDGAMAWIGLLKPDNHEIGSLADEFDLHELAVEDAIVAHQRPKLERYGETLFVVLRAAWYLDATEEVDFGEVHVFVGPDFVVTVRHSDSPDLAAVRRRLESNPELLALGPEAILYAIVDRIVDGYAPVVAGLQVDIDQIETEVFRREAQVSRRIYELSREVVEFQRTTAPLQSVLRGLMAGFDKYGTDEELQRYLRDVEDHLTQVVEQIDGFRHLLREMMTVNATLVGQQQNEEMKALTEASIAQGEQMKKVSAWAAILFAPTLVGGIYGMNFDVMPELHWAFGYPMAIGMMLMVGLTLYIVFKRRDWI